MIEQIRKFKKGGNSGPSLKEAKTAYEQALETASPALRHNAQALINYAEKLRRNNQYSTLEDAQGMLDIYNEATNILSGSKDPILPSSKTWGTRAISDFYDYQKQYNRPSSSTVETTSTSESAPSYKDFKPKYFDTFGLSDMDNFQDKLEKLINSITTTLQEAKSNQDRGVKLLGYSQDLYSNTDRIVSDLQKLKSGLSDGSMSPRSVYNKLLQLQSDLNFDPNQWDSYFGTSDDLTLGERNLKKLVQEDGHTQYTPNVSKDAWYAAFGDNGQKYRFTKDRNGQIYIYDDQYNKFAKDVIKMIDKNNYVVTTDGKVFFGDIFDDSQDQSNQPDALKQFITTRKQMYDDALGTIKTVDSTSNNVEGTDDISNALLQYLKSYTTSKKASVVNISHILGAPNDRPVYAFVEGGGGMPKTQEGYLNLYDNNLKFITYNNSGEVDVFTTFNQLDAETNHVDAKKIDFLASPDSNNHQISYADYTDIFNNQKDVLSQDTNIGSAKSDNELSWGVGGVSSILFGPIVGTALGLAAKGITSRLRETVSDNPQLFVNLVIQAIKAQDQKMTIPGWADNVTGREFLNSFGNIMQVINTAGQLVQNGQVQVSPEDFNILRKSFWDLTHANTPTGQNGDGIVYHKSGGVLKAEEGTSVPSSNWVHLRNANKSISGLYKAEQAAKEAGYETIAAAEADKSTELTTSDYMRFATMAADVSSIVASFVPGIGTGVAAGMGVVSMGTDLVADILDPSISSGQVVKNLGMNAAFAATGLIPGAKMHKVTASLVKWAPKIITAVSALGIATDESTQQTLKKISDGKEKLTHADWRNLARVLSVVASGTRMAKGSLDKVKLKHSVAAGDNVKLKGVKTADGFDYELPKEKVQEINKALKKAKTPADVEKIKAKYKDIPDEAFKLPSVNDKGKFEGTASLVETTQASAGAAMREIWNKEAEIISKQAQENPGWFAFANKFGGGAYSGTQRAILSNPELAKEHGFDVAKYLEYKGAYNPMYDSEGIRTKAGMIGAQRKPQKPAEASTPKSTPTPAAETTSVQNAATPITQNPTIGPKFKGQITNLGGSDQAASYSKSMRNMLTVKRSQTSKYTPTPKDEIISSPKTSKNKDAALLPYLLHNQTITIPQKIRVKAWLRAKALGINIDNKNQYFKFLSRLKSSNPAAYNQLVGGRNTSPNLTREILSKSKQDYGFKQGGQLKYQHLRK